jgi:hypothetical protein
MNCPEKPAPVVPSAREYILDNFELTNRIAMLVLNRDHRETIHRITGTQKASPSVFSTWGTAIAHTTSSISVHTAWPVLVVGSTARRIALQRSSLRARKIWFAFSKTSP